VELRLQERDRRDAAADRLRAAGVRFHTEPRADDDDEGRDGVAVRDVPARLLHHRLGDDGALQARRARARADTRRARAATPRGLADPLARSRPGSASLEISRSPLGDGADAFLVVFGLLQAV